MSEHVIGHPAVDTQIRQLKADKVLPQRGTQMQTIDEPYAEDRYATLTRRAAGRQCRRRPTVLLCQVKFTNNDHGRTLYDSVTDKALNLGCARSSIQNQGDELIDASLIVRLENRTAGLQ